MCDCGIDNEKHDILRHFELLLLSNEKKPETLHGFLRIAIRIHWRSMCKKTEDRLIKYDFVAEETASLEYDKV